MLTFVHAADLHLDSPMRGLSRYEGAPVAAIRGSTRRAMEGLVRLCIEEKARFLVISGDVFDGDWRDYSTGLFFAAQMTALREADIRVFLIRGNHDAESVISKRLPLPGNVVEFDPGQPQSHLFEELGVAVHGQSFPSRSVTEDLAARYPDPVPGLFNIGLLHTSLEGRPGHDPYAPTSVEVLADKRYDYWALGHVHQREVVCEDPFVVFPGNLQGRHVRETGPKGATVVTVDGQRVVEAAHAPLDVVRWQQLRVDATDCVDGDGVIDEFGARLTDDVDAAEGRLLATRVIIEGRTDAHEQLIGDSDEFEAAIRATAHDVARDEVWIERVRIETRATLDLDETHERDDPIGQLARALRSARSDEALRAELSEVIEEFSGKLPKEAQKGEDGLRADDPATLDAVLTDIERTLLPRLLSTEEP